MTNRLEQLSKMLEAAPGDSFLLFAIAKEYEKMGNPAEALAFYENLRAQNPAYTGLYYHLGKLYERIGAPEKAVIAYREGMEVARKAGDVHALGELNGARMELEDD
jgi:tetratricopeptide (TPR) repeat protein